MTASDKLKEEFLTEQDIARFLAIEVTTLRNKKSGDPDSVPPISPEGLCHLDDFRAWQKKRAGQTGRRR